MNNYLTEVAINKLQEEIEHRKVVVRKRRNENLKEAKAYSDFLISSPEDEYSIKIENVKLKKE